MKSLTLDAKSFLASVAVLALLGMAVGVVVAQGATEGSVAATVTVQNISVTVADGVIVYGTLEVNTQADTTSVGVDDTQVATNNGNITENLNIKGDDSSTSWTLAGAAGSEQYRNDFCITDCDSSPVWTALTTSYQTLNASVAKDGTQDFDLRINTPTATADFTVQSIGVVVQATTI